jgi:hypothetical protein
VEPRVDDPVLIYLTSALFFLFLSPFLRLSSSVMTSSSPSLTTTASRSPSPVTPSTPDDTTQVSILPTSIDLSTWYKTLPLEPTSPSAAYWDDNSPRFLDNAKEDTTNILSLDDLIQDCAYEE